MSDIKSIIAKNIAELRQKRSMTQLELAEKLNYSDKAVSKWERAESLPDVSVLVDIAELFEVPLDYLIREEHSEYEKTVKQPPKYSRGIITSLSIMLVWFIAVFVFVVISSATQNIHNEWIAFVYAVPVSMVVWLVMNSIWFNRRLNYLIISLLTWTGLVSLHLTLYICGLNIWLIYMLGIPLQIIIVLWANIKKVQNK